MDNKAYQIKRTEIINSRDIIDLSRIDYFNFAQKKLDFKKMKGKIEEELSHSLIVENWLDYVALPVELKLNIFLSESKENPIKLLMETFNNKKWYVPYSLDSFYEKMAHDSLQKTYSLYHTFAYDNLFRINGISKETDIILLDSPIVPYGRKILDMEINTLRNWLHGNKERRLIINCENLFEINAYSEILDLFENTKQVYLIFSLSKSWLIKDSINVMFVPDYDLAIMHNVMSKEITKKNMANAYLALNNYKNRPEFVKELLRNQIDKTAKILKDFGLIYDFNNPCYLFYSSKSFDYWLERGILTIPVSTFSNKEGVIISTLYN